MEWILSAFGASLEAVVAYACGYGCASILGGSFVPSALERYMGSARCGNYICIYIRQGCTGGMSYGVMGAHVIARVGHERTQKKGVADGLNGGAQLTNVCAWERMCFMYCG